MSTRAIYTFREPRPFDGCPDSYHVYKHHDGYPEGAVTFIRAALDHAWILPRFEADDFAAAFVAANKPSPAQRAAEYRETASEVYAKDRARAKALRDLAGRVEGEHVESYQGGGVRLMPCGKWQDVAPRDIEYRYEISLKDGELHIRAFEAGFSYPEDKPRESEIFAGTLAEMLARFEKKLTGCG